MRHVILVAFALVTITQASAEKTDPVVKYKTSKDLSFDQLLIEGQLRRPELSVVTGDSETENGLLRLRENFIDRMADSAGEEAP